VRAFTFLEDMGFEFPGENGSRENYDKYNHKNNAKLNTN